MVPAACAEICLSTTHIHFKLLGLGTYNFPKSITVLDEVFIPRGREAPSQLKGDLRVRSVVKLHVSHPSIKIPQGAFLFPAAITLERVLLIRRSVKNSFSLKISKELRISKGTVTHPKKRG